MLGAGRLAAGDAEDALALEAVEVLGEAAGVGAEEVALDKEEEGGVDFIEVVEDADEVAWVAVGGDGEEVAEGGREQGCELLFGEELCGGLSDKFMFGGAGHERRVRRTEEGGLELVDAAVDGGVEFHGVMADAWSMPGSRESEGEGGLCRSRGAAPRRGLRFGLAGPEPRHGRIVLQRPSWSQRCDVVNRTPSC